MKIKMKGEIPVFKRCCFCLPLRYGLLAWGYFKITADAILVLLLTYAMINAIMFIRIYEKAGATSGIYPILIKIIIAIVIFFTDFVVIIVFIVGGHKKNVKLIRVFYFLSLGMWVISCLVTAFNVVILIQIIAYNLRYWKRDVMPLPFFFVAIIVQSYFLILLRSEIMKLRNNSKFRFVNNAAEAECTMTSEEIIAGEEIERQDV